MLAAIVVLYFALPGHPDLPAHGLPLGPAGTAAVAAAVVLGAAFRGIRFERRAFVVCGGAAVLLMVARVAIGLLSPPVGWTARYFANEQWAGAPEWSSDFPRLNATRIDRRISFKDDTFPAHYLNDVAFNRGDRREVTEPMSVEWRAFAWVEAPRTIRMALTARGSATLAVDGRIVLRVSAPKQPHTDETVVTLTPGTHEMSVRYLKPPDTDGLIEARAIDADGAAREPAALVVAPAATGRDHSIDRLRIVAQVVDGLLLILFAVAAVYAARLSWRGRIAAGPPWLTLALCALFGVQGWWQAIPFAGRVRPLTSGDDWWGFESCARDILHHGPLMTLGKAIGHGDPYFYHPFYSYFLAAIHGISGESLFGPVFVQFLMLAVVALIMWRLAGELFGDRPAFAGLVALVVIFELDFTRYYTVTLLSENLYILTVTLTLVPFVRWVRQGARADLIRLGFWGGVSTVTRPPMLLYLFPALALIALVSTERSRRVGAAFVPVAIAAAAWLAAVAPATLRNLIVAHRFVLVSDVQSSSVLTYNIPPSVNAAEYGARFRGTFGSALNVVGQIGLEHPLALLGFEARKIGFSLGMIHWAGGYRPHPELVAVTVLYLAMCVASARMRSRQLWPVHLFVLVHLASMILTMPWNYGYRLIIPPFVYTATLSTSAFASLMASRMAGAGRGALAESHA